MLHLAMHIQSSASCEGLQVACKRALQTLIHIAACMWRLGEAFHPQIISIGTRLPTPDSLRAAYELRHELSMQASNHHFTKDVLPARPVIESVCSLTSRPARAVRTTTQVLRPSRALSRCVMLGGSAGMSRRQVRRK